MRSKVTALVVGVIIGIVLGFSGSYLVGQRYTITKCYDDTSAIKTDRWTGKTWLMLHYRDSTSNATSWYWDPVPERR
jgi:hypothetical protein